MKKVCILAFLLAAISYGAVARVAHVGALGASGTSTFTTGAIDTTGATACVAAVSTFGSSDNNITDSKGNTWIYATPTQITQAGAQFVAVFYTIAPAVGSGHTFTVNNGRAGAVSIACYSGVNGILPFDKSTTATTVTTTMAVGPLTAANNGSLLITAAALVNGVTFTSVDSGFSIYDSQTNASLIGVAIADLVQNTAAAITPTWTFSAGANRAEGIFLILIPGITAPPSGGVALVAHASIDGTTTAAVNTTGANFCIGSVASTNTTPTFSDSKSNTWTGGTLWEDSALDTTNKLFWVFSPTVGAGHTFTAGGTAQTMEIYCFSGISNALQSQSGVNATTAVMNPQSASRTPTGQVLLVAGIASTNQIGIYGIDSGFQIAESVATNASHVGGALAYYVANAGTWAPSWSFFSAHKWAASIAVFATTTQPSVAAPRSRGGAFQ